MVCRNASVTRPSLSKAEGMVRGMPVSVASSNAHNAIGPEMGSNSGWKTTGHCKTSFKVSASQRSAT